MPLTPSADRPETTDIGQRMTLRMHDPEGGYRDILGILESTTTIRKRDGSIVSFDPDRIALWRRISPRIDRAGTGSPLSLRIEEIERAAAATWPATEEVALGDWILRASGKFTMRANSALALGDPHVETEVAINRVVEFYQERNLTPTIHIALPTYVELDALLESKGWIEKIVVHVMVTDIDPVPHRSADSGQWEFSRAPSDEWIRLQKDEGVREIMVRYPAIYAGLRTNGELIAAGRTANFDNWTVLSRLFVLPDQRGKGLGKELMNALLNEARAAGATKALLQVDSKNASAIGLYKKMGFHLHHAFKYRLLQPSSANGAC